MGMDEMTNSEKFKIVADHYGYDSQSRQCCEECAELIQAINKFWRKQLRCGKRDFKDVFYGTDEEKNILEEIADVQITLWQMEYLLNGEDDVKFYIQNKLNRQIERIREEEREEEVNERVTDFQKSGILRNPDSNY